MIIKELPEKDYEKYTTLNTEYGTIFTSLNFLNLFKDIATPYGIYQNDGQLIGGFYLAINKRRNIKLLWSVPFAPYIGPFYKEEQKSYVAQLDFQKTLNTELAKFIDGLKYPVVSLKLSYNITDTQPYTWNKFKVVPNYSYILNLDQTEDQIWENMASENRNDIRKGEKEGLKVNQTTDYNMVYELIKKSYNRKNVSGNETSLKKILFDFANKENSFAMICLKEGEPISTSFCLTDKHAAYYLLGGYDEKKKHHSAGTMNIWEAIKFSKKLGLYKFDFEGSMLPEIEKYFRKFGGKLTPLYRINKANLPLEVLLKIFKRELF